MHIFVASAKRKIAHASDEILINALIYIDLVLERYYILVQSEIWCVLPNAWVCAGEKFRKFNRRLSIYYLSKSSVTAHCCLTINIITDY